jgi:hypothetical protein
MRDAAKARKAAEELGAELARRGARLLVYGGLFVEADVVRGFVAAKPPKDHSILMWYSKDQEPPPFPEEANHPSLFERRAERGGMGDRVLPIGNPRGRSDSDRRRQRR